MKCASCATQNPDDARFCLNCGTALTPPRPIEGERKIATVLFADVVGSTSLAERLDPELWAELMNGAFGFMNAAVDRYQGTVGRLMGDAILAFFGAPTAHEDDAERAVRAALDIRRAAIEYGHRVRRDHGLAFEVRVGINTGLSVLTTVGDATKAEYTAMGDTANVAARLQSLARPNTVLIGEDTYSLVRHHVDVEPRGEVAVKGRERRIRAYEVVATKSVRGHDRGLDGLSSPLVGRTREVAAARERLAGLRAGRGAMIAIVGEAGLGKSRLAAELRRDASRDEHRWLEGRGLSYTQGVHYFPWRQVLLASLGASDADSAEAVRRRLRTEAAALNLPAADLPYLEAVLAVEGDENQRALADHGGAELVQGITQAIQAYVRALAAVRPTVLVFDDLHWADPASTALIAATREVVDSDPLLVICALRPEKNAPSWGMLERLRARLGKDLLELQLQPLAGDQARELLDNLLHIEGLPDQVRRVILDRTDGNPFFIEEVIRTLIDSGHIVPDGDHWRATAEVVEVEIPETLIGVLSARIDRLPDNTRRVAQTAAVIGRSFARSVLASVFDESPEPERVGDLTPHLGLLSSEELVRKRAHHPDLEYVFKHALTQEAAYERLLLRRRKELHRRTGFVLERLHGDRRDDVAPILAHHFSLGEEWVPAARYALRAGARAFKLYALDDAAEQYEDALGALERTSDAAPTMVIDAILGWITAAVALRRHEDVDSRRTMLQRLERAVEIGRTLDDKRRLTTILVAKGNVLALSGLPVSGFGPLLEAHDLARELGDDNLFLMPLWAATEMMVNQDPRGAAKQFARVIELAQRARNKTIEAHATGSKAVAHARLGEFAEARVAIEAALDLAKESGSRIKEADVDIMAGTVHFEMGEMELGHRFGHRGTERALEVHGFECACSGLAVTGLGKLETRRYDEAQRDFERSIALGTGTMMEGTFLHFVHGVNAAASIGAGDRSALAELETALAHAERVGDEYSVATLAHVLGATQLRLGQPVRAASYLDAALASFRARGMRPYEARVLATLAAAYEAQGRDGDAAAARAESERMVRELRERDRGGTAEGTTAGAAARVPGSTGT